MRAERRFRDVYQIAGKNPPITQLLIVYLLAATLSLVVLIASVVTATLVWHDLSWIEGLSMFTVLFPYVFLLFMMVWFGKRRAGGMRCCAQCDYPLPPLGKPPANCSECGADLKSANAVVAGQKLGTSWPIVIGLVVLLLVFMPTGWIFGHRVTATSIVPTQTLVDSICSKKEQSYDIYDELQTRSLDHAQLVQLLDAMETRLKVGEASEVDDYLNWKLDVASAIAAHLQSGRASRKIQLRVLRIYFAYSELGFDLKRWAQDAIDSGTFSDEEVSEAKNPSVADDQPMD